MKKIEDIAALRHSDYFAGLTGLRGFAALWVMLLHFYAITPNGAKQLTIGEWQLSFIPFLKMGWLGVHFFFVLSGFLLSIPFLQWIEGEKNYPKLPHYYAKRILRVFPAYYFQLLVILLLALTINFTPLPTWESFFLHLFMLIRVEPWFVDPIEGVWWTLPTELSFYLVLPLIAVVMRRCGVWAIIAAALLLTVAFRYWVYAMVADQGVEMIVAKVERFPGHVTLFVAGIAGAYFFRKYQHFLQQKWVANSMLIVGLLWLLVMTKILLTLVSGELYFNGHYGYFVWNSLNAVGITMLVVSLATRQSLCRIIFENRLMVFLGVISYSIYLWHFLIMRLIKQYWLNTGDENWSVLFVSLPLVVIVSLFSYRYIEAPFMRLGLRQSEKNARGNRK